MVSNTLLRRLRPMRLLVAMHLNEPSFRQSNLFRHVLKKAHPLADYRQVRNALTRVAITGTRFEPISPLLQSMTGLAMSSSPVLAAHVAVKFTAENPEFVILGGCLDGARLTKDQVVMLSELPMLEKDRKKEIGGRMHSELMGPAASLIGVLQSQLMYPLVCLQARKDHPAAAAATPAAAAPASSAAAAAAAPKS